VYALRVESRLAPSYPFSEEENQVNNVQARSVLQNIQRGLRYFAGFLSVLSLSLILSISPAMAQISNAVNGTVANSARNSITVRTPDNQFIVFTFARGVRKPASIPVGSQVRVISNFTNEQGVRQATDIMIVPGGTAGTPTAENAPTIPSEVGRVERDIERSARHYQIGISAGVGLDPELILIGATGQFGPIFSPDLYFRPGVEFGFGEVTTMVSLNPEVVYRLPLTARSGAWTLYVGGGPGFNLTHKSFKETTSSGSNVSFHALHDDATLNILGGIQRRGGMFTEIKTSVYAQTAPVLSLVIGYRF
jgi:hypothetical protein